MQNYGTARSVFSFVEFVAWCAVIIGVIVALIAAGAAGKSGFMGSARGATAFIAAMPGMLLAFLGFIGVLLCQTGRAAVDSAEYGQQMLKIARDQLDVSKQALRQSNDMVATFAALQPAPEAADAAPTASFRRAIADTESKENKPQKDSQEKAAEVAADPNVILHGDQKIVKHEGLFWVDQTSFKSEDLAKAHIDRRKMPEAETPAEATAAPSNPKPIHTPAIRYEGHTIVREKGGYLFEGQFFSDLEIIKRTIDNRRNSAIQLPPY